MAVQLLSPGVLTREVDLTVGRAENVLDNIGAIAGPFSQGPIDDPIQVETEQELIKKFGKPLSTDAQYEYWMTAASYLTYGGIIKVVRTGGGTLNNANAGSAGVSSDTSLYLKNYDDYKLNYQTDSGWYFAAQNPGQWANTLKVCMIDDLADQTLGVAGMGTFGPAGFGLNVGYGVTVALESVTLPAQSGFTTNATSVFNGYLKGIITGINTAGAAGTMGGNSIDVKIVSRVETVGTGETETKIYYQKKSSTNAFQANTAGFAGVGNTNRLYFRDNAGALVSATGLAATTAVDWYDQQKLPLDNGTIFWKSIASKPVSNAYVLDRQGKNDGIHVAVIDDSGTITGIQANILEVHPSLSKAADAVSSANAPTRIYYKDYLADFSDYIFAGRNPSELCENNEEYNWAPTATGFTTNYVSNVSITTSVVTQNLGLWGLDAQGVTFSSIGNQGFTLKGGQDYDDNGGMKASLGDLITSYNLFRPKDVAVDFLIMGPGCATNEESQAKAGRLISVANERKDCIAVIGPHRSDLVGKTDSDTQTNSLLKHFNGIPSTSYAIFDSGYKYTFDRFNNQFRYIPTNGDIAGLCVRTALNAFPWYSPAGQQRGILNNAVKLSYNPNQAERDQLYEARINPVVFTPGLGVLLFGDKTALGYASAFDRINVRRLFLTVEQALQGAAEAQLFELNDELTRANFINIVEPYLRDVQAKRGVYDYLVICDETNNTPDIIDNNEFRADIFLKPTKSINYVTLTFVATRTGVDFQEVAGRV